MHEALAAKPIQERDALNALYSRKPAAEITLPGLPPTVNHAYRRRGRGGGMFMTKAAREWKEAAEMACRAGYRKRAPLNGRLAVLIVFVVKTRGRWDLDNRLKSLLDALTGAGVWEDDKQICHITAHIEVKGDVEGPHTKIYVWELQKGGAL
jgi:crossover junction endodeoxyribonuclease RusA